MGQERRTNDGRRDFGREGKADVGAQYSTEIQKYGNTDPFSVFYPASIRIIGFPRVNLL